MTKNARKMLTFANNWPDSYTIFLFLENSLLYTPTGIFKVGSESLNGYALSFSISYQDVFY